MERFAIGDKVTRLAGREEGVVVGVDDRLGYEVLLPSGAVYLDKSEIERTPYKPEEALRRANLSNAELYGLRIQALYLQHAYRYDELAGLSNARIEPAFHQVMVALQVLSKTRPRMILADEVGLGKTIEAGMILKELRARRMIDRVLIVVPPSLQWQWRQELSSKFNEDFEVLDGPIIRSRVRRGENPWLRYDNVICSMNTARREDYASQIVEAGWDMVIFDEAHKVRRSRPSANRVSTTLAYRLADELKESVSGFLLLTATPMQLHPFELYSLIELVEPGLFESFEKYEVRQRELPVLTELTRNLQEWETIDARERDRTRAGLRSIVPGGLDSNLESADGRETAMNCLTPLARTLIRNRKTEVGGFTERRPALVAVALTAEETELYEDVSNYIRDGYDLAQREDRKALGFVMVSYQKMLASSSSAIREALRKRIRKLRERIEAPDVGSRGDRLTEEEMENWEDPRELSIVAEQHDHEVGSDTHGEIASEVALLEGLADRLGKVRDSKASRLLKTIQTEIAPGEKVLIFTQFLQTQSFLQKTLEINGYEVEIFNGVMDQREKDEAARRFRDKSQILVATEAGGEGRNFQFAHIMFNYDLPWNPMKVEQRIGRLDRIGQREDVVIYNFACQGTIEERILEVLQKRIRLFEESVGPLDPILGEVEKEIRRFALSKRATSREEFEQVAAKWERRVKEARMLEEERKNFVLDPATFRRDEANRLVAKRTAMAEFSDLQDHIGKSLRYFGGRMANHPDGGVGLYLSGGLQSRLKTRSSFHRGVFDYRLALEREDLAFFAFGHELVDAIVQLPIDYSEALACHRRVKGAKMGPFLEFFYAIEGEGPVEFGQFVHHMVGEDLAVSERQVVEMPTIGAACQTSELPQWFEMGIEASKSKLAARRNQARIEVDSLHRKWTEEELERTRRTHEYRKVRLKQRIEEESAWIEEKERIGTPREKRVLPARRGMLEKNLSRLEGLEGEFRQAVEAIKAKRSDVSLRVLAAALVVGE